MKILHVIPSLAPCHGGPSVVLPIMERALTNEGVSVETITTDDDGPGSRIERRLGQAVEENGVIRRYFPKQTEFYKVSFPLAQWMKHEVKRYDVVHIHALFSFTSIAGARAARTAGVPFIIRPLGLLNQYGVENRRAGLKTHSLRWVEGPLLRDAAAVHFTLDAEKQEAERLGLPFNGVVIPLGIESQRRHITPAQSSGKSVLFMSRIDPKKNIETLLDVWAHVHEEHPAWNLVIAGSGTQSYLSELRRRATQLGIDSSVDWIGHVEGEEKKRLMEAASVYTLPSYSENFGIAAAEALYAGKACVFTPGVAVGALAGSQGAALVVEPNAKPLARALTSLMADGAARKKLATAAVNFAERELSSVVMGKRLKSLYESLATGGVV